MIFHEEESETLSVNTGFLNCSVAARKTLFSLALSRVLNGELNDLVVLGQRLREWQIGLPEGIKWMWILLTMS